MGADLAEGHADKIRQSLQSMATAEKKKAISMQASALLDKLSRDQHSSEASL